MGQSAAPVLLPSPEALPFTLTVDRPARSRLSRAIGARVNDLTPNCPGCSREHLPADLLTNHLTLTGTKEKAMSWEFLTAVLAFGTLGTVTILGYNSSVKTQQRLHANKRKSTLASDAPSTLAPGVKPVDT